MRPLNYLFGLFLIGIGFTAGISYFHFNSKSKLDQYYFNNLKEVKKGLLYGSSVDSKESIEDFEDRIELYMHLDGYNGVEILNMKCNAIIEVLQENKTH